MFYVVILLWLFRIYVINLPCIFLSFYLHELDLEMRMQSVIIIVFHLEKLHYRVSQCQTRLLHCAELIHSLLIYTGVMNEAIAITSY